MIKIWPAIFFFTLSLPNAMAQIPPTIPSGVETESDVRLNLRHGPWSHMFEHRYRDEVDGRHFQSLRAGSYFRLTDWLKLGAFYQRQWGERHEEDWVAVPRWHWKGPRRQGEDVYIFDTTLRTLFGLEEGLWVGEFKLRYFYNEANQHASLRIRPGLTRVLTYDDQPLVNLYTQYEAYVPLNYSTSKIYEWWWYLGALFHVHEHFKIGPSLARREVVWTESPEFRQRRPGQNYHSRAKSWVLGVQVLVPFDI